ncbi:LPP20 family lipoprotein [Catenovulum maritimum]|uniref:LPP20 lipoprotein n=1 Tax=Catenovulum maritimum TaxID=1513271 RepID=A0A0J8GV72_9ALTE|nr:LPP20 family lipoprotein [Catenovulum maritimum]KMT65204.1 hypothetical protein XM47_10755 [Catenovulum maritimum]
MLYRNIKITSLAAIFIISGCSSTGGSSLSTSNLTNQTFNESKFLTQVPSDNANYYYATGVGETVEIAKNKALSDIASRISVSIAGSLTSESSLTALNDQFSSSEKTVSTVKAVAKEIDFTGVSIVKKQQHNFNQYVLVEVDRNVLAQGQINKWQTTDSQIKHEMSIFDKSALFYGLKMSNQILGMIDKARAEISMVSLMLPSYSTTEDMQRYLSYQTKLREIKNKAVFHISADQNSMALSKLIKSYLSSENIKISDVSGNVNLELITQAKQRSFKTTNEKLKNMIMADRTTTIRVKNDSGVVISNNLIKTKATSNASLKDAIEQTKAYQYLIDKSGVLSFLSGKN